MKPFRAFWVKYTNVSSLNLTAEGARAGLKAGCDLEFPLWRDANMIGNPLRNSIQLCDANIRFRRGSSSEIKTVSQAVAAGWVRNEFFYWNPVTSAYVKVYPNTGHAMPPYRGYFLCANRDHLYIRR